MADHDDELKYVPKISFAAKSNKASISQPLIVIYWPSSNVSDFELFSFSVMKQLLQIYSLKENMSDLLFYSVSTYVQWLLQLK